jgi:Na+/proline symporter
MLQEWVIVLTSFAYLGLLFAIAYYADQRADRGRSIIASPYIYSLSLAVYATAWTFYGSVGRAAIDGVGFLPIYLGPTLMIALWWIVMRKILRISKQNRITSLADFIASRYGKSALLGGIVTIIAVVGIVPYISLQLKAVSNSFIILLHYPEIVMPASVGAVPILRDTALWVALILALFTILFGTRHLYSAEHHEGMVAAIAFESLVKLLAFLAIGAFVTFGVYNGFGDVFSRAAADPKLEPLLTPIEDVAGGYASWVWLTILSMLAIMFLPRQFQVTVIENVDERHLQKAIWLFPAYMVAINIFVLPLAFGGRLLFPGGGVDADTFVLAIPMLERQELLALLVFVGGLSASTGMVIVETIALSTMVCNDLVMPILLSIRRLAIARRRDLTGLLLGIRRTAIVLIVLLGYIYFRLAGEAYALVHPAPGVLQHLAADLGVGGMDAHVQRREPLGHDPFEICLGEPRQRREVAVQERQPVVVVFQVEAAPHPLRELVDEAELTVVVAGPYPIEDRARHLDAQRLTRPFVDLEGQIEATPPDLELDLGLIGGELPLDDVARHISVDPHDLVARSETGRHRR